MKTIVAVCSVLVVSTICGDAAADDVAGASKAFARAQSAVLNGNHSSAADLFELADNLAPSSAALRSAARARYAAGHAAAAATHAAELLRRYPDDSQSRAFAEELLKTLAPELARISVACSSTCTLELGSRAVSTGKRHEHVFFAVPGPHEIVATFADSKQASVTISAVATEATSIAIEEPAAPEAESITMAPDPVGAEPRRSTGLRKRWAIGAGITTAGFAAAATVFGISTLRARDDIRSKVATGDTAAAEEAFSGAETKQLVTNVFIAGAAIAGATTVVLGLMTDWSAGAGEVGVVATDNGGAVTISGRF